LASFSFWAATLLRFLDASIISLIKIRLNTQL
jgi:hypothetical protein